MSRIVTRATLNPTTFLWELDAPDVARAAQAGQFVMVRLHDGSERIPLTIADFDRDRGTVTVVSDAVKKALIPPFPGVGRIVRRRDGILHRNAT